MRRLGKYFSILTLFIMSGAVLCAQETAKESRLSRDSILIGDQVVWSLGMDLQADEQLLVEPYGNTLRRDTTGVKIEILQDFVLDTLSVDGDVRSIEAKMLITSFDSGSYRLPVPLFIIEKDGVADTLEVEPPVLAVNTIQVDTTGFIPMDIKGQINYPVTFREILPWCIGGIALIALVYLLLRYIKYRRENKDFFGRPIVKDPPHIVALRELDRLRAEKLWQNGKEKQFYTGITDTLREYIEKRYCVSTMEKTSGEILGSLADKEIEKIRYEELEELFKLADLVKFAKFVPDIPANEDAVPKAVRFVNSTFMQELEQEKEAR